MRGDELDWFKTSLNRLVYYADFSHYLGATTDCRSACEGMPSMC